MPTIRLHRAVLSWLLIGASPDGDSSVAGSGEIRAAYWAPSRSGMKVACSMTLDFVGDEASDARQTRSRGNRRLVGELTGGLDDERLSVAVDGAIEAAVAMCVGVVAGAVADRHGSAEARVGVGRVQLGGS